MIPDFLGFVGTVEGHLHAIGQPGSAPDLHIAHLRLVIRIDQLHLISVQCASNDLGTSR